MNLVEASKKMATLMKAEADFHPFWVERSDDKSIDERYSDLRNAVRAFGEELAAIPYYRETMICWMVDINGISSECENESLENAIATNDIRSYVERIGGNLAVSVEEAIATAGFHVTDRGGGGCRWHIGVPCDDTTAKRLCNFLNVRFQRAITSGMLRITKRFWSFRLPGLYTWDDAERFLDE